MEKNDAEGSFDIEELFSESNNEATGPSYKILQHNETKNQFIAKNSINNLKDTKTPNEIDPQFFQHQFGDSVKARAEKIIEEAKSLLDLVVRGKKDEEPLSEKERRLKSWEADLIIKAEKLKMERDQFEIEKTEWELSKNELVNGIVSVSQLDSTSVTNQISESFINDNVLQLEIVEVKLSENVHNNSSNMEAETNDIQNLIQEQFENPKISDFEKDQDEKSSRKRKLSINMNVRPKRKAATKTLQLLKK